MTASGGEEIPVVIDPSAVFDVFVTGTFPPEWIGDAIRVTYYQDRHAYPGGPMERVIVARNVFTPEAMFGALAMNYRLVCERHGPVALAEALTH